MPLPLLLPGSFQDLEDPQRGKDSQTKEGMTVTDDTVRDVKYGQIEI